MFVVVGGWGAWLLGSLLPTWAYLSIAALEMGLARVLHLTVADEPPANAAPLPNVIARTGTIAGLSPRVRNPQRPSTAGKYLRD